MERVCRILLKTILLLSFSDSAIYASSHPADLERCGQQLSELGWDLLGAGIEPGTLGTAITVVLDRDFSRYSPLSQGWAARSVALWVRRLREANDLAAGRKERLVPLMEKHKITKLADQVLALELRNFEEDSFYTNVPEARAKSVELQKRKEDVLRLMGESFQNAVWEYDNLKRDQPSLLALRDWDRVQIGTRPKLPTYYANRIPERFPHVHAFCLLASRHSLGSVSASAEEFFNNATWGLEDEAGLSDYLTAHERSYATVLRGYLLFSDPLWGIWDVPSLTAFLSPET